MSSPLSSNLTLASKSANRRQPAGFPRASSGKKKNNLRCYTTTWQNNHYSPEKRGFPRFPAVMSLLEKFFVFFTRFYFGVDSKDPVVTSVRTRPHVHTPPTAAHPFTRQESTLQSVGYTHQEQRPRYIMIDDDPLQHR